MSEITKIRLLAMISSELEQVNKMISNEKLWMFGSTTKEDSQMHSDNIKDLEEFKEILKIMESQIVKEGCINV